MLQFTVRVNVPNVIKVTARPLNWRERGRNREKERESFTENLSRKERFSAPVEIKDISYWALSLQKERISLL
jgi:hypothetical protein